jgi:hypothetical protein
MSTFKIFKKLLISKAQISFFIWVIGTKFLIDRGPELEIFGLSFESGAGHSPNLELKGLKTI